MDVTDTLSFTDTDRRDIYEYIERHGTVTGRELRRALGLDQTALGAHVTVLKREGYVRETDEGYVVAYTEEAERHEAGGVTYTIRTARQNDLSDLVDAIRVVASEGTYMEAETVAQLLDHEEVVLRSNGLRSRTFFIACDETTDEVVGWVHLDLPEIEKLSHTAVLTVGLRPDARGKGLGSALHDRGVEWARDHGFERLYNSAPSTNETAIEWLSDRGWEREAVRRGHYRIDGEYVDEVMMALDL